MHKSVNYSSRQQYRNVLGYSLEPNIVIGKEFLVGFPEIWSICVESIEEDEGEVSSELDRELNFTKLLHKFHPIEVISDQAMESAGIFKGSCMSSFDIEKIFKGNRAFYVKQK